MQLHGILLDDIHQTYQNFIVSLENNDAYEWMMSWPINHPTIRSTLLIGDKKSGKKHLIHEWAQDKDVKIMSLDDPLLNPPTYAIVVIPDSLDKENEEKLFHLFNFLKFSYTVYVSCLPLPRININLPDLRSRLLTCHQVEILPPDDAFLKMLYSKQFHDLGLNIHTDVIDYLAARLNRQYETIFTTVRFLNTSSLKQQRPITIPFIKSLGIC
ncbi:MAG: DnaA regulatory inactivator Hda [Holosporales bacterium]